MAEKTKFKLLQAKSTVVRCNCCGRWMSRLPTFMGIEGEWDCEDCGCTSIKTQEGRPYGPKSHEWSWIENSFNNLSPHFDPDLVSTVTTEPPFQIEPKHGQSA